MKYNWHCKCGAKFGETVKDSDFCLIVLCFHCGATNVHAIHRNTYNIWEKLVAWYCGRKLEYTEKVSISGEESTRRWREKYGKEEK